MQALAAQRDSARSLKSLALADLKPTVAFTGNLQYQEDAWTSLWTGDNRSYQAGFAVQIPLSSAPRVASRMILSCTRAWAKADRYRPRQRSHV